MRLAAALLVLAAAAAAAEEPAASFACDRKAGTLVIRFTPELAEARPPFDKRAPTVKFWALLDVDAKQTQVVGTRTRKLACRLAKDRLEAVFAPGVPNPNLLGRCGAAITGVVTVTRNGEEVLKEREFEDMNCHARARMLARITFRDGRAEPELEYAPGE